MKRNVGLLVVIESVSNCEQSVNTKNCFTRPVVLCQCLAIFLLSACSSPRFPLQIKTTSINPDPIVGQVVTLHVEVLSTRDESDVGIVLSLPAGIEITEGESEWHGALVANQTQSVDFSIRVTAQGEWPLYIRAYSRLSENSTYGDSKTFYILSSSQAARVSDERSPNHWYPPALSQGYPIPKIDERFESALTLSNEPSLSQEITVTYTLTSTIAITNAQVVLGFPQLGFELVSTQFPEGKTTVYDKGDGPHSIVWVGYLDSPQPINLTATFEITDIGRGEVYGYLIVFEPEGEATRIVHTASAVTYLEVTELSGRSEIYTPEPP